MSVVAGDLVAWALPVRAPLLSFLPDALGFDLQSFALAAALGFALQSFAVAAALGFALQSFDLPAAVSPFSINSCGPSDAAREAFGENLMPKQSRTDIAMPESCQHDQSLEIKKVSVHNHTC